MGGSGGGGVAAGAELREGIDWNRQRSGGDWEEG